MNIEVTTQEPLPDDREAALPSVLVVDDDPILRALMSEQLAVLGWRLLEAEDGEDAIGVLAQDLPGLAIIDINMPKLDGFALLRHLRQNPRTIDLPVIVCTGHNDRESIDRAYRLGASHFVTKPINWPMFLHHVQFVMRSGETERDLRTAKAEALAASQMKSAMFQVLTHELKTPLTAMIGMTEVLGRSVHGRLTDEEDVQFEHVIDASRRLNGIVSDILLLSKAVGRSGGGEGIREIASLSEILEDGPAGFRRQAADKGVKLVFRPLERDVRLLCDLNLIRQALAKLVDNAVKFSPVGGTVELWGHVLPEGQVALSVKDEGPGLSAQKLKDCLQPFVQENMSYARPADGLGLGLPIARTICEAHGGELVIQTAPGRGLLAALVLPSSCRVNEDDQAAAAG